MVAHRTRSPFFDYKYVINTVRLISVWMRNQTVLGVFDRIDLGTGFLRGKKKDSNSFDR